METNPTPTRPTVTYAPDAVTVLNRTGDLLEGTRWTGLLPMWTDTAVAGRDGTKVIVVFAATPVDPEDAAMADYPDVRTAEVAYANLLDEFRRDGWTVRESEPWETPDPLASDAPTPF